MNFNLSLFCLWFILSDLSVMCLFTMSGSPDPDRLFHPTLSLAMWPDTALNECLELDRKLERDPQRGCQGVSGRDHCDNVLPGIGERWQGVVVSGSILSPGSDKSHCLHIWQCLSCESWNPAVSGIWRFPHLSTY